MRIQEMKSGILHLKKKIENEPREIFYETGDVQGGMIDPETGNILPFEFDCEFDEPRWSVVSFDQIETGGLTYVQASELMNKLNARGITGGHCVVTDEAASRIQS